MKDADVPAGDGLCEAARRPKAGRGYGARLGGQMLLANCPARLTRDLGRHVLQCSGFIAGKLVGLTLMPFAREHGDGCLCIVLPCRDRIVAS